MHHVLVIEDVYLFGEYLRDIATLASAQSEEVAATQSEAISAAIRQIPSLSLSSGNLDGGNGPAAFTAIIAKNGAVPVLFVIGDHPVVATLPKGLVIFRKTVAPMLF